MNKTREILERPFQPNLVKRRPGRDGSDVVYIEGHVVVTRLNEAFAETGDWSFEIERHEILDDEVLVLGRLSAGGIVKMAFGSSAITRAREGGKPVSVVDDLKSAATDSLKKAATLLGVALQLHGTVQAQPAASPASAPAQVTTGNGHLSQSQFRAVHAIRRRLGWDDAQLAEFALKVVQSSDVEQLDKRAASVLIERLQLEAHPVGAAR